MAENRDGAWTWTHSDHLHSTTVITDKHGYAVRRLAYSAFGEPVENTGTGDAPTYTYTAKEADASGLLYYGARYYDPALARFITADTVYDAGAQGLNRYSYALNNPIMYNDPTGHFVNGPHDSEDPTGYGCITGSQGQFADGSATMHDGHGFTVPMNQFRGSLPVVDPHSLASPYRKPEGSQLVRDVENLQQEFLDEDGSIQQRFVDVQAGAVDELISQYTSNVGTAVGPNPLGRSVIEAQGKLLGWGAEQVLNVTYDTALGGLRPREGNLWYTIGKYGTTVIIFLATVKAGSTKTHGHHTYPKALGGHPKQQLADILEDLHTGKDGIHSELATFEGGWLRPRPGMTEKQIVTEFGQETVEDGLRRFYSQDKWKDLLSTFEKAVEFTHKHTK